MVNLEYQYISTQEVACHNPEQRERQVPWNIYTQNTNFSQFLITVFQQA
jgi:hypothetical protein